MLGGGLQIGGLQASVLANSRKHLRPELDTVMKGKDEVCEAIAHEDSVRARLPRDAPAESEQCGENDTRFRRRPFPHEENLRGERYAGDRNGIDVARFNLIGKDAECQGTRKLSSPGLSVSIDQDAGKLWDLSDPTAVGFLLELDR